MTEDFAEDLAGKERLLTICSRLVEFYRTCPYYCRLAMRVFTVNLEVLPEFDWLEERREVAMQVYASAVEQGQREGEIRPGDPMLLAGMVAAMVTAHHLMDPVLTGQSVGVGLDELLEIIGNAISG
jgi:TetR/AcrR family transcriptional regulator